MSILRYWGCWVIPRHSGPTRISYWSTNADVQVSGSSCWLHQNPDGRGIKTSFSSTSRDVSPHERHMSIPGQFINLPDLWDPLGNFNSSRCSLVPPTISSWVWNFDPAEPHIPRAASSSASEPDLEALAWRIRATSEPYSFHSIERIPFKRGILPVCCACWVVRQSSRLLCRRPAQSLRGCEFLQSLSTRIYGCR